MVDCTKNLYEILGISPFASSDEIKKAYKKLVRIYHPDVNKSLDADIKFKLLNNAYDVLSDEVKRKNYDNILNITNKNFYKKENENKPDKKENNLFAQNREQKKEAFVYKNANEKFDEILKDKNSVIQEVRISKKESLEGTTRTVNILNTQKCPKCSGKKFINGARCSFCLGEGEKKEHRKIEVDIKKNVQNNEYIYVGKINSSALYDKKLFLKIIIEPPQKLYFEGDNILIKVQIPLYDAILGTKKEVYIEQAGFIRFEIPPLTKPNARIPLKIEQGYTRESIRYYATIEVIFPETLSKEEEILYDRIRKLNNREEEICRQI